MAFSPASPDSGLASAHQGPHRGRGRLLDERSLEDSRELEGALRHAVEGEVRFDAGSRALYATDLSIYRHVPIGVVIPRHVEDVIETVAVCRRHGVPNLGRGCGTSLAGQTSTSRSSSIFPST